jgi:hypothetical protein
MLSPSFAASLASALNTNTLALLPQTATGTATTFAKDHPVQPAAHSSNFSSVLGKSLTSPVKAENID